jgi:hypothetical protein
MNPMCYGCVQVLFLLLSLSLCFSSSFFFLFNFSKFNIHTEEEHN